MTAPLVNLGPTLAGRRLFDVERPLVPVEHSLADLLAGRMLPLPPLPPEAEGYRVQSAPVGGDRSDTGARDLRAGLFRRFERRFIDMETGYEAYMAQFSGKTRATLRRKSRKFAELSGGEVDWRGCRTAEELESFFEHALPLSARTYQHRSLGVGLPQDRAFREQAIALAGRDCVRAFLLFVDNKPVSYLYLPVVENADGTRTVRYDHLGYDPDHARHSPGTVLQLLALEALMAEGGFRWFDFTAGDGAHKQMFATGSAPAESFVLLRATLANRLLLSGVKATERAVETAGALAERFSVKERARRLLRAR